MNIVVCIKPIKSELIYPTEMRNEVFLMNPYDLYALEHCIELKKKRDCKITCICMGAKAASEVLTKAIAMGADEAILLNDNAFMGSDTVATTYVLAQAIHKMGNVDLIVCGEKTIDGETGQVPYGIGERLGIYCIPKVEQLIDVDEQSIILQQKDGEVTQDIKINMPVVISFGEFRLSQPSISLLALKRAKRKEITVWTAKDIDVDKSKCGLEGSKTKVFNIASEFSKKDINLAEGTITDKVNLIFNVMGYRNMNS